ncbi:MAG: TrkA C-terminal domain-containing protein, partial [Planctomycetes bacterium]|nr:TrkA C-terminal domain-containing protein [Planctomycetota bacterium]
CGKRLLESRLHEDFGIVVLTIKHLSGNLIYNPQGEVVLEAGHILVVVGHHSKLKLAKKLGQAESK